LSNEEITQRIFRCWHWRVSLL